MKIYSKMNLDYLQDIGNVDNIQFGLMLNQTHTGCRTSHEAQLTKHLTELR
jgi:hypothetical protein